MKTNVTCSLDADLVARLDAWRAPMGVGRSTALELLLEALPEPQVESPGDQVRLYFDSNGNQVEPGTHHDNPKFDMPAPGKDPSAMGTISVRSEQPLGAVGDGVTDDAAAFIRANGLEPFMGASVTEQPIADEVPTTPDPAAPSPPVEPLEPSSPTSSDPAPQPSGKASHGPGKKPSPRG